MPPRRAWLALLLVPLLVHTARADEEIPTVGRPADLPFSGASGSFRVWAIAAPTTLEAQQPLTLTLHVEARSDVHHAPQRIDLRELPAFKDRFLFEETGANEGARQPDARHWEFVYRLRPKREDVSAVPGMPFVFYNPEIQYPRKGFQVAYTDPIPLTVRPHGYLPTPVVAPECVFALAPTGDWRSESPPIGPWAVAVVAAAPPLLCFVWLLGWRRLYPDAAQVARQKRSLAARRALQALRGAEKMAPVAQAARCAAVVAEYLRGRIDASVEEPTPDEAADSLRRAGCAPALAEQAAAIFRDCDAARFAPVEGNQPAQAGCSPSPDLPEAAARFILAVEAETWSTPRS